MMEIRKELPRKLHCPKCNKWTTHDMIVNMDYLVTSVQCKECKQIREV